MWGSRPRQPLALVPGPVPGAGASLGRSGRWGTWHGRPRRRLSPACVVTEGLLALLPGGNRFLRRETCSLFPLRCAGTAQICFLNAREMSHPGKEGGRRHLLSASNEPAPCRRRSIPCRSVRTRNTGRGHGAPWLVLPARDGSMCLHVMYVHRKAWTPRPVWELGLCG